jgi:DNA-binding transcriptional regulator PaaX
VVVAWWYWEPMSSPRNARLGVAERAMRNAFKRAVDAGLIVATTDGLHDPNRAYRLTENGHRQLARLQAT